jgi:hypothetical protein
MGSVFTQKISNHSLDLNIHITKTQIYNITLPYNMAVVDEDEKEIPQEEELIEETEAVDEVEDDIKQEEH